MDELTLDYYRKNANSIIELYRGNTGSVAPYFDTEFEPGSSVLDIGYGIGV